MQLILNLSSGQNVPMKRNIKESKSRLGHADTPKNTLNTLVHVPNEDIEPTGAKAVVATAVAAGKVTKIAIVQGTVSKELGAYSAAQV